VRRHLVIGAVVAALALPLALGGLGLARAEAAPRLSCRVLLKRDSLGNATVRAVATWRGGYRTRVTAALIGSGGGVHAANRRRIRRGSVATSPRVPLEEQRVRAVCSVPGHVVKSRGWVRGRIVATGSARALLASPDRTIAASGISSGDQHTWWTTGPSGQQALAHCKPQYTTSATNHATRVRGYCDLGLYGYGNVSIERVALSTSTGTVLAVRSEQKVGPGGSGAWIDYGTAFVPRNGCWYRLRVSYSVRWVTGSVGHYSRLTPDLRIYHCP
jgi:hypothetical protein